MSRNNRHISSRGQCSDPMMTYKTGVMGRRVGPGRYFRTAADKVGQNFAQGFC